MEHFELTLLDTYCSMRATGPSMDSSNSPLGWYYAQCISSAHTFPANALPCKIKITQSSDSHQSVHNIRQSSTTWPPDHAATHHQNPCFSFHYMVLSGRWVQEAVIRNRITLQCIGNQQWSCMYKHMGNTWQLLCTSKIFRHATIF